MTAVVRGDALHIPLRAESVDLIVTSPPYFALRSYRDGGEHYDGQIGSEPTPQAFLEALWAVTAELWRVLKPSGSLFVNLGDKRAGSGGAPRTVFGKDVSHVAPKNYAGQSAATRFGRPKSKMLLPHRYAIGCEDGHADPDGIGWIVRSDIVWSKPNGLPESVRDRVRDSHEYWFHLTKQGDYFSAVDEIREAYTTDPSSLAGRRNTNEKFGSSIGSHRGIHNGTAIPDDYVGNPLGKLPGSVWTIPSEPLTVPDWVGVDHFAAFPQEWPRRLILGWSPSGICTACGEGRMPVVAKEPDYHRGNSKLGANAWRGSTRPDSDRGRIVDATMYRDRATITGYACACTPYTDHPGSGGTSGPSYAAAVEAGAYPTTNARAEWGSNSLQDRPRVGPWREYHLTGWQAPPTRPAVVLDCFGGTGTVAMVARALGRTGISLDLSADYCRLAKWRIFDSGHASKTRERTNRAAQGALL